jgi:hypothetical protein
VGWHRIGGLIHGLLMYVLTEIDRYERVSKSFRTESTEYMPTTTNTRCEATQRVMAAKLTRLTHKIAIQLHLVAESCIICSSCSRLAVRKIWIHPRISTKRKKSLPCPPPRTKLRSSNPQPVTKLTKLPGSFRELAKCGI